MKQNRQQSNEERENIMKQVNFSAFIEYLADLLIAEKEDKSIDKDNSE